MCSAVCCVCGRSCGRLSAGRPDRPRAGARDHGPERPGCATSQTRRSRRRAAWDGEHRRARRGHGRRAGGRARPPTCSTRRRRRCRGGRVDRHDRGPQAEDPHPTRPDRLRRHDRAVQHPAQRSHHGRDVRRDRPGPRRSAPAAGHRRVDRRAVSDWDRHRIGHQGVASSERRVGRVPGGGRLDLRGPCPARPDGRHAAGSTTALGALHRPRDGRWPHVERCRARRHDDLWAARPLRQRGHP